MGATSVTGISGPGNVQDGQSKGNIHRTLDCSLIIGLDRCVNAIITPLIDYLNSQISDLQSQMPQTPDCEPIIEEIQGIYDPINVALGQMTNIQSEINQVTIQLENQSLTQIEIDTLNEQLALLNAELAVVTAEFQTYLTQLLVLSQQLNVCLTTRIHVGPTGSRPNNIELGHQYFDTDLSVPIWWSGPIAGWITASGTPV